ncbi:autophagy-related protein 13a-like isoform X2 [Phragmites australis]|uniref:autophagy-related protein 13a-like isoform X2 n=1 Tax=Phragmites australis TaxID=29695 RepID=UPI002D766380|nr:autophagy-related protein 13a-like isoform X2 [Phragmites australis]
MANLSDSAGGGSGRAGAELMVPQFLLKALHAILAVRAPRPQASAPAASAAAAFRRRDRWFHLPLHAPPPPPAAEHLPDPSPGEPLVVDVYLAQSGGGGAEEVVERWTVACEPWPSPAAAAAVGEGLAVNRSYKRCITLLRSLYTALRFLPAYRAFRLLCASGQVYNYEMGHRVGSFAAPFSRTEELAMRTRSFAPVETQLGRIVVSVQYLPTLAAFNFVVSSLATATIITDYVGSPAAEPMSAFPASLTEAAGSAFPLPSRRPNSWASPAPWPHTPGQQAKFSPPPAAYASPTPSPPTFAGGYLHSRFSGETAPMSIPQVGGGRGPVHHRNMSEPNKAIMFPPPSPKSVRGEAGIQESPKETSRSFRRADGIRMGDLYANLPGSKIKDSRDESGRFSGVFSSSGSPHLGVSRSSSRLSMPDDTDDTDFPFAVDDVDPDSRPGSGGKDVEDQAGSSSHKSQDAAVGYLVHLLKSARPLRDPSYSTHTSRAESTEAGSTSSFMSRRTSDAFEELESFKELRENLLAHSRSRLQDSLDKP